MVPNRATHHIFKFKNNLAPLVFSERGGEKEREGERFHTPNRPEAAIIVSKNEDLD